MANKGIAPPDMDTNVGQLRVVLGDLDYSPLDPPETGFGNYVKWSDAELTGFLAMTGAGEDQSILRAAGYAFLQLAASAALESKSVRDHDLQIDLTKRAADLRAIAQMYFTQADDLDDSNGSGDIFDIFPMTDEGDFIPEGTVPMYGRRYTWSPVPGRFV